MLRLCSVFLPFQGAEAEEERKIKSSRVFFRSSIIFSRLMATSNSIKERSCCICFDESGSQTEETRGTNICGGCEKRFCNRHYKDHRAYIDMEFQELGEEHDLLVERLNSITSVDPLTSPLIEEINRWETETIDKVRFTAKSARKNVIELMKQDEDMVKNQLRSFTDELRGKESTHEHDEIDIEEIKLKLNELQQKVRNLSHETIKIQYQEIEWNTMVTVYKTKNQPSSLGQAMQSDINRVCLKGHFCDTTLLTLEQQIILNKFYGKPTQQWKLLYKATRDGFQPNNFHDCCDKNGPTMTVYQDNTSRYLFGGFTTVDWTTPDSREAFTPSDSHAFLFTLSNPHSLEPTKFPIRNKTVVAAYHREHFGPSFGLTDSYSDKNMDPSFGLADSYSDIYYNSDEECHVCFPGSYTGTTNLNYGSTIFTGTTCFRLSEIEVFTLL